MAKIRTKLPVNWGGFNPLIENVIEVELIEKQRNSLGVTYEIRDTVIAVESLNMGNPIEGEPDIIQSYDVPLYTIRKKELSIPTVQWDGLYTATFAYIDANYSELSKLEQDMKRESVGLLIYIQTDVLTNGKCGYNTEPTDWEIVD